MSQSLGAAFDRAQRAYDNQMPPDDPDMKTCELCNGDGVLPISECCDVEIVNSSICSKCQQTCDPQTCSECNGKGEVEEIVPDLGYDDYHYRNPDYQEPFD